MEPVKPIEGNIKDAEGQSSALADVVRARYWKQLAEKLPPVESSEEADVPAEKQPKPEEEQAAKFQSRHTYAEFQINQETREVSVKIFDADSGALVRSIPPDELAKEIAKGNLQPNQLRRRAVFV